MKVVTKFHGSTMLQRKDIVNLIQHVAKQWKLRSNGHSTKYRAKQKHSSRDVHCSAAQATLSHSSVALRYICCHGDMNVMAFW